MNTLKNEDTNVLIMFPASKNFPLEEMISESFPSYEDERFDNDDIEIDDNDEMFPSLEAFMNRHKGPDALTPDDKLILKINESIDSITEAKERLKFYLEELNIFMPAKK